MASTISIAIVLANASNAIRGLKSTGKAAEGLESKFSRTSKTMSRLKGPAVAALAGIAGGAFKAGQSAAELADSIDAARIVLGSAAGTVEKFSSSAATNFGISKQAATDAAVAIGNIGSKAGLSGNKLASFTTDAIGRAGDMASMFGGTATEAVEAMGSALRGEFEPIRRYGVQLDAATLQAAALKMGIIDNIKTALTPQQKALVVQSEVLRQTAKAQGNFAATSDSAKNKQEALKAQLANVTAQLGTALLPIMSKVAGVLSSMAGWVSKNETAFKAIIATFAAFASAILVMTGVLKIVEVIKGFTLAMKALNLTFLANPIFLVIAALVLLVAGLVIAYKKSETFRAIVDKAFRGIKAVGLAVFGFLRTYISGVIGSIRAIISGGVAAVRATWNGIAWLWTKTVAVFNAVKGAIQSALAYIGERISAGVQAFKNIFSKITELGNIAGRVRNAITGAFSGAASWLLGAGRDIIQGLIRGISSMLGPLKAKAAEAGKAVKDGVKGLLHVGSPSRVMKSIGKDVMKGLLLGIDSQLPALRRQLQNVTGAIDGGLTASPRAKGIPIASGALQGPSGATVQIIVNVPPSSDPAEVGRQIVKSIKAYESSIGRTVLAQGA